MTFDCGHGDFDVRPDIARLDGETVHFRDGSSRDYDLTLLATGYQLDYPFLDRGLLNWRGASPDLYLKDRSSMRPGLFPQFPVHRHLSQSLHRSGRGGVGQDLCFEKVQR